MIMQFLPTRVHGRGPDSCIEAVGMEAHGTGLGSLVDHAKVSLKLETDRPFALRQAIQACRKGGTVSVVGVFGGVIDFFNAGAAFNKGLTIRMGQMHAHRYIPDLLARVAGGEVDASFPVTHRLRFDEAKKAFETFKHQSEDCCRVVLRPN